MTAQVDIGSGYKDTIGSDDELEVYDFTIQNDPTFIQMNGASHEAVQVLKMISGVNEEQAVNLINIERGHDIGNTRDMYLTPTNLLNIIKQPSGGGFAHASFIGAQLNIEKIDDIVCNHGILAANPKKSNNGLFVHDFNWVYFKKRVSGRDGINIKYPAQIKSDVSTIGTYCGYICLNGLCHSYKSNTVK